MKFKIKIEGIAHYHPDKKVDNEFYLKQCSNKGKDRKHVLCDVFGRSERYEIDWKLKRETSLTMQIEAVKRVLKKCKLEGCDIDGIIVASQFPEYLVPCSAMFIHEAIGGKENCFAYDMNANCIGMIMAYYHAANCMRNNSTINRIVIVNGDYLTQNETQIDRESVFGQLGDLSCAIIVSRDNANESGIVDYDYFIKNQVSTFAPIPEGGLATVLQRKYLDVLTDPVEVVDCSIDRVAQNIMRILEKNHLSIGQISAFCFTQYVRANINKICDAIHIPKEKVPYLGDKYGYTGANSPFLALESCINNGTVKRGDYVFFWTTGASVQQVFLLAKY